MSACTFDSLPKSKYSNIFNVAAFSTKYFSDKISLLVKNSYLLTFLDDKADILAVCLSKSYRTLFYSILLLIALIFSLMFPFKK